MRGVDFLMGIAGFTRRVSDTSADRPIRLATIDPAYVPFSTYPSAPPPARVTFDGESTLSGKAYPYAAGMLPWPGTRVTMLPIGNTYLIGGVINPQTAQGFWSNATGTEAGVEFGAGSFFDTDEGLVIAHDVSISGDLTMGGNAFPQGRGLVSVNSSGGDSGSYGTTLTSVATLVNLVVKAGRCYRISHGGGVLHTNAGYVDVRLVRTTGTVTTVWQYYRYPITAASVVMMCQGEGYIRNTTASDITLTLQLQMAASVGTGIHAGGADRRRYLMAEDVGRAADWLVATTLAA